MSTPTELLITRHGEAHCNTEQIVGGPLGCRGLTAAGHAQVLRLAERLRREHADRPIDAVYTTPLRRARESALIVGDAIGQQPRIEPDLRETDYGDADGKAWAQVVAGFAAVPAQEHDRAIAPGAETWREYLNRSTAALNALLDRHAGRRILIVGHGETVATAAHLLLRLPITTRAHAGFAAHPASVTRWEQQPLAWARPSVGWRWTLIGHNDVSHL